MTFRRINRNRRKCQRRTNESSPFKIFILVYIIYIKQSCVIEANVKIKRNYTLLLYKYSSSFALLNPVGKLKLIRLFDKNIL